MGDIFMYVYVLFYSDIIHAWYMFTVSSPRRWSWSDLRWPMRASIAGPFALKGACWECVVFPVFVVVHGEKPIRNRDQIGRLFWIYIGSLMRSLWDLGIFNWRSVHRIWSHLVISQGTREAMGLSRPRRRRCRAMGDERSDEWEIAMAVWRLNLQEIWKTFIYTGESEGEICERERERYIYMHLLRCYLSGQSFTLCWVSELFVLDILQCIGRLKVAWVHPWEPWAKFPCTRQWPTSTGSGSATSPRCRWWHMVAMGGQGIHGPLAINLMVFKWGSPLFPGSCDIRGADEMYLRNTFCDFKLWWLKNLSGFPGVRSFSTGSRPSRRSMTSGALKKSSDPIRRRSGQLGGRESFSRHLGALNWSVWN